MFLLIGKIKRTNAQSLAFSGRSRPFCSTVARVFVSRVTRPPRARGGIRRIPRSSPLLVVVGAKSVPLRPRRRPAASGEVSAPLLCPSSPHENRFAGFSRGPRRDMRGGAALHSSRFRVLCSSSPVPRRGGGCSRGSLLSLEKRRKEWSGRSRRRRRRRSRAEFLPTIWRFDGLNPMASFLLCGFGAAFRPYCIILRWVPIVNLPKKEAAFWTT